MADAHRNVSVDITGDSSGLDKAFDNASKKSDDFDKEQDKNAENDKSRWKSWGDSVNKTFDDAWNGIKGFGDKLKNSKFGLDFGDSETRISSLKDRMGSFVDDTFNGIEKVTKGIAGMSTKAELIMYAVLVGIAAIGPSAAIAAGALVTVLGGALLTVGIIAAAQSGQIKGEFANAWQGIKDGVTQAAGPIEQVLMHIPSVMRDSFATLKPALDTAFAVMAPAFDNLVSTWGESLKLLAPALQPLGEGLAAVFNRLSDRAPEILGALGHAIETFGTTALNYADDFASAVTLIFKTVDFIAVSLEWASKQWHEGLANLDGIINVVSWSDWQSDMAGTNIIFEQINQNVKTAAEAIHRITERFDNAAVSASVLKGELDGLNGVHITADLLAVQYEKALDKVTSALKDNGATLDIDTKSGQDNALVLIDQAKKSNDLLVARADEGAKVKELNGIYEHHRDELIASAIKLGATREEAKKLADKYLAMPKSINTKITADTSSAQGAVDAFITFNSGRTIPIAVLEKNSQMRDGGMVGYAGGGYVSGPGGSRSDSIPIRASRGEYVVNAASARRYLPELDAINKGKGGSMGGTTVIYQINTTVAPTANLAAVGSEVVKAIQAHEQYSSNSWRKN